MKGKNTGQQYAQLVLPFFVKEIERRKIAIRINDAICTIYLVKMLVLLKKYKKL